MRFTIPMLAVALGLCAAPAVAADGKELYLDNCAACHQPTGKGIPGAFPALAGSKVAQGDPKEPITRLLKG
ncbi:MAG: cytochrome c, partial [Phenylobacterium sp.]|nr:cytochrome c [Phenylobacterium sp.]